MILALITTTTTNSSQLSDIINKFGQIKPQEQHIIDNIKQHPKLWTKVASKLVILVASVLSWSAFALIIQKIQNYTAVNKDLSNDENFIPILLQDTMIKIITNQILIPVFQNIFKT